MGLPDLKGGLGVSLRHTQQSTIRVYDSYILFHSVLKFVSDLKGLCKRAFNLIFFSIKIKVASNVLTIKYTIEHIKHKYLICYRMYSSA